MRRSHSRRCPANGDTDEAIAWYLQDLYTQRVALDMYLYAISH